MTLVSSHSATAAAQEIDRAAATRIERLLKRTPLIDGHNDLPWELREKHASSIERLLRGRAIGPNPLMTDIERLRQGRVGGQFWSVYLPSRFTGPEAIKATAEQIDLVRRMVARYPADLELASTAADVRRIHAAGRIASMMGIEGGHQIGNSLPALRQFHALGVRYMTLTWNHNNDWADSATDNPVHGGLSAFGLEVVREMNRLGMIIDISHVSADTMNDVLDATRAPVMFSHSNARALSDYPRNVPDTVLRRLPANGGVVMVNAYPGHLSMGVIEHGAAREAEQARVARVLIGRPAEQAAALAAWDKANPRPQTPLAVMADHIEHVARIAGHDHVGIGADLDGVPFTVTGMEDVAGYPRLFAELIRRGWTDENLAKLAGGNILRVMAAVERVAAASKDQAASIASVPAPPPPGSR